MQINPVNPMTEDVFDNSYLSVVKCGKVVKVSITGNGITSGEDWSTILKGNIPQKNAIGIGTNISNGTMYWLRLNTNQTIDIITATGSAYSGSMQMVGELTYIAKN